MLPAWYSTYDIRCNERANNASSSRSVASVDGMPCFHARIVKPAR